MSSDKDVKDCRQRAAEMRALAEKTCEPAFRRSCEELADGWEALARQQDALDGLGVTKVDPSPALREEEDPRTPPGPSA